jgi:Alginate export
MGSQQHSAAEIAAEAGYRFSTRMQPWIRAGYFRSTGDPDPNDTHHNTFFQVLSTPRAYARFPSYILMNTEDRFGQFKLAPSQKLALRSELHFVGLSNVRDLWYDGGGAYQEGTFGYLGRPSGGNRKVGTSLDLSVDYALSGRTSLTAYGGVMRGNAVPALVFPAGGQRPVVHLFSIEIVRRF